MSHVSSGPKLSQSELDAAVSSTLQHYDASAESFRAGTWDHDVSQNYAAFLDALVEYGAHARLTLLDLGCGPGRDLQYFRSLGHEAVGLDGSAPFVAMARATGCEVLHQSFLQLELPAGRFHGVFANASLFHVPRQELPRVLRQLHDALRPAGVLFSSNPHGNDTEGFTGGRANAGARYGSFHTLETWRQLVTAAGFQELQHYYRPAGKPRDQQPWLATVWRRP
jgi:SAM-dependent methyltransferase